jgi:hypothetical protein
MIYFFANCMYGIIIAYFFIGSKQKERESKMISVSELKENPELKSAFRHYSAQLFLAFNGSLQTYLAVTQDMHDEGDRQKAWDIYDKAFDKRILASLLEVFDKNKCGIAEVCIAVLKLLEIAGSSVAEVEDEYKREERTHEYWEEKFAMK